jgi:hypothetical protein
VPTIELPLFLVDVSHWKYAIFWMRSVQGMKVVTPQGRYFDKDGLGS